MSGHDERMINRYVEMKRNAEIYERAIKCEMIPTGKQVPRQRSTSTRWTSASLMVLATAIIITVGFGTAKSLRTKCFAAPAAA
jgi:hypothetical protein